MSPRTGTAIVTGGGRGIGLGVSQALAEAGYDLVICGVRPEGDVPALADLRGRGREVAYVQADISTDEGRDRLLAASDAAIGVPNLLVNNAGVAPLERRDILDATAESYDRVMSINLRGPYFLTQAVARRMVAARTDQAARSAAGPGSGDTQGSGAGDRPATIVFVTSISATVASTNRGEYCLSKAGLAMAAQLWAVRLAEHGIPVYEVRPGIVMTDMTAAVRANYEGMMRNGLLLQARWGMPLDVGKAVVMLARGDLGYSTGQVIMVDGGMSVARL